MATVDPPFLFQAMVITIRLQATLSKLNAQIAFLVLPAWKGYQLFAHQTPAQLEQQQGLPAMQVRSQATLIKMAIRCILQRCPPLAQPQQQARLVDAPQPGQVAVRRVRQKETTRTK